MRAEDLTVQRVVTEAVRILARRGINRGSGHDGDREGGRVCIGVAVRFATGIYSYPHPVGLEAMREFWNAARQCGFDVPATPAFLTVWFDDASDEDIWRMCAKALDNVGVTDEDEAVPPC